MVVHHPPANEADVTIKSDPVAFVKLVTGNADPRGLFLRGKLKVDGDLMLAARLGNLFVIPSARPG